MHREVQPCAQGQTAGKGGATVSRYFGEFLKSRCKAGIGRLVPFLSLSICPYVDGVALLGPVSPAIKGWSERAFPELWYHYWWNKRLFGGNIGIEVVFIVVYFHGY